MSTLIDLDHYAEEVAAFAGLAAGFVAGSSTLRLDDVERQLRQAVEAGQHTIVWETRDPIIFRPGNLYDGPGREHAPTSFSLEFRCEFSRPTATRRRCRVWQIVHSATHVSIEKEAGGLRFHVDYKNAGQWGPQVHLQIEESPEHGDLPIPRIPAMSFLPTDCADLALSELHPEEWRRTQGAGGMQHHMSVVRNAQESRTLAYVSDIRRQWNQDTRLTRISMLQDYTAAIAGLPDRHGRDARY
ncbi:MAG: hypothetical protein EON93_01080 [Burkholderiales bacterium]|nr:MAG: hypothetical protein EON93_01080 [Burkholderiales bacterium]